MSKPKKGKKKDVAGPEKVTNAEAALYNLEIEDAEKKIERLRKHLQELDTHNDEVKEKIRFLKWDRKDQAADLTKSLASLDQTLYEHNEELHELTEEFSEFKKQSEATINHLEGKYKAMHDQLTSEIKLLKAKFQMITDFRARQDAYAIAMQRQQDLYEAKVEEGKNQIELKGLAIEEEKLALLAEFKEKLYQVSTEFTSACAMKSSPYTQRIIRENIALEKEVGLMERTLKTREQNFKEHMERFERAKTEYPKLNKKKSDLILSAQKKQEKIARMTSKFESLRKAYIESLIYKNRFEDMVQHESNKNINKRHLATQVKKLASRSHVLKAECQYMAIKQVHNEKEIERLCKFISEVKSTLLESLGVYERPEIDNGYRKDSTADQATDEGDGSLGENRHSLLQILLHILRDLRAEVGSFDSFENVSIDSFVLRCKNVMSHSSEAMQALRESTSERSEIRIKAPRPMITEIHVPKLENAIVIPRERSECALMFDVETGSSFYISSGRSIQEIVEKEPQHEDIEEEQSSSDDNERHSESSKDAKPTPAQAPAAAPAATPGPAATAAPASDSVVPEKKEDVHEMPPGTIVDVVMEEEEEEFPDRMHDPNDDLNVSMETFEGEEEMSHFMFY